ncbi:serine hydrolase domain-containing protein [Microbacterium sp.]|uniref:serine hydrolase domain-containing protein n=1 Tax=Microbacterium sp. TaxID=51671 RepID=UPI0028110D95|nr:serine hydrolase domain-containing protein [Microbacterium sp.]
MSTAAPARRPARPTRPRRFVNAVAGLVACTSAILGCTAEPEPTESGSASSAFLALAGEAGSTCVAISAAGSTIVEQSTNEDAAVRAFSITKSVTSLLIGIAQDDGSLRIEDAVADFVPSWRDTASSAVTIEDLLANTSGREWDSRTDYREMALEAQDKTAFAIALGQESRPDTEWVYNNSAIQVLEAVLEAATGRPVAEFARTRMFEPLGMDSSRIEADAAGNANLFAGLWTTCADLVRLGDLVLSGGLASSGTRVVSAEYIEQATGGPSTDLNAAYGLLWWLNRDGTAVTPEVATSGRGGVVDAPLVPVASADTIWALGLNDQVLAILPSEQAVAVRLGGRPAKDSGFSLRSFTAGALSVLEQSRPNP